MLTDNSIEKIDIIYADVQDFKTIIEMTKCTSVIINCVGPYYLYGEIVVKHCVLNSTHYVDVTGESLVSECYDYPIKVYNCLYVFLNNNTIPHTNHNSVCRTDFEGSMGNKSCIVSMFTSSIK